MIVVFPYNTHLLFSVFLFLKSFAEKCKFPLGFSLDDLIN